MLSDNFIAGFQEDGRMSVVRRFFSLFVTFDLIFTTLLWLISVVITGEKVQHAFVNQVLHYSIYTSLFDIGNVNSIVVTNVNNYCLNLYFTVVAALCRFSVLILFYALIYLNHWIVIAVSASILFYHIKFIFHLFKLSTSCSCAFLISKVFLYDVSINLKNLFQDKLSLSNNGYFFLQWTKQQEPVFQVLLVLSSFILAWGEAWFLGIIFFFLYLFPFSSPT